MAVKVDRTPKRAGQRAWRKAPLTADSPDAEARAMARSAELMALLQETDERGRKPGGTISHEELLARNPLPPEAEAEGAVLAAEWAREQLRYREGFARGGANERA